MNDPGIVDPAAVEPTPDPAPTAPENISVNLRGFDTEEHARTLGDLVASYVRALSRHIDLSTLDGITVAFDYAQALLDLDRGYPTNHKLKPSEELAVGVAMTPSVLRDGKVKSHMLFHAGILLALEDEKAELHGRAVHTLAHECAHVEVTARFDEAFPGILLQTRPANYHDHCRWEVINACWDEYAVTQICAPFGERSTDGYEQTFIEVLEKTRARANDFIKAYRLHGDVDRILAEVYGAYGELMKFGCYHLGNLIGLGLSIEDRPKTKAALQGHWFEKHFDKLTHVCAEIAANYGKWSDRGAFDALGDLADVIVAEGGLFITDHQPDGQFRVDIPFTPETMPDGAEYS